MLLGQRRLDARLLLDQPVERGVYLALGDINETDRQRQTGGCHHRRQGAVEGELRPRCYDPLNDHRLNQIAHALVDASAALQRSFEPEFADHGLHRSHMAVRQTANNLEAGVHPTKRADLSRHGYRAAQFEDAFARFLPPEPNIRTLKRGAAKRRESVRMFG